MINSASIFNNLILGYVIFTFNKLDLFPLLKSGLSLEDIVKDNNFEKNRLKAMFKIAQIMGLLEKKGKKYHLTKSGEDVEKNRGFFTWAIGGYSPLLEALDTFLITPTVAWQPYVRGEFVAIGSDEVNQELMQHVFDKVVDSMETKCIADLGCGNAGRLVNLLQRRPELTGVGIDINQQAIEVAQKNRDQHGLSKKIDLVCENVFTSLTKPRPEFHKVDLVMSFMMLHDLFNIKKLQGKLFTKMRIAFPRSKYFLFADTCLDEKNRNAITIPVFTMGYELIHKMRGIQLFSLKYYKEQFKKENLELVAQYDFIVPKTYLFMLKV